MGRKREVHNVMSLSKFYWDNHIKDYDRGQKAVERKENVRNI